MRVKLKSVFSLIKVLELSFNAEVSRVRWSEVGSKCSNVQLMLVRKGAGSKGKCLSERRVCMPTCSF